MPRGRALAHRPPAPLFWKNWCPLVLWSGKGQRKPSLSCPPPTLTAEWEHWLKEVERGTLAPGDFMDEIAAMLRELVETCRPVEGSAVLFPSTREAVGRCPRCGGTVTEGRQGFFCENRACGFAIWKNSKWWENKKKTPTKAIVAALLKDGRTQISGLWSEKTGKTYTATVALTDDGTRASFRLEFSHE